MILSWQRCLLYLTSTQGRLCRQATQAAAWGAICWTGRKLQNWKKKSELNVCIVSWKLRTHCTLLLYIVYTTHCLYLSISFTRLYNPKKRLTPGSRQLSNSRALLSNREWRENLCYARARYLTAGFSALVSSV